MIRLGLRLTVNGGREAAVRLAVTAAAMALGVTLLLITLAGINALNSQNARSAWLNTGQAGPESGPRAGNISPAADASTSEALWWLSTTDQFSHQTIDRVDVAATGPGSPIPPGISHLPGPGQFYASPALSRLLRSTPEAELGDRFPGLQIGTIGPSALPSPNSLIAIIGHTPAQLSTARGAEPITRLTTKPSVNGRTGWDSNKLQVILAVGALALLFPVFILIGTATRLSAARREQRFAAMRLVGATPRQVSVISAVEASVAAIAGVAAGFGLFFLLRPPLTNVPFTGAPFVSGDLSLGLVDVLLVAVGVPVAAATAARVALRRVQISPLGVSRRVTPPAPRAYRLVPLMAGIGELAYFVGVGHPQSTGGQIQAYFFGFLLTMAGLVIAGPWLTMAGSRVMARRTSRPAVLIAGRRLADNPRGAFRAISGLIIALFVTSAAVGIITTIFAYHGTASGGASARNTLVEQFSGSRIAAGPPAASIASFPDTTLTELLSIRGVQGVALIHSIADASPPMNLGPLPGLASCAQLSRTPALGRCPSGADVVMITQDIGSGIDATSTSSNGTTIWPAAALSSGQLQGLRVQLVAVATNGSSAAIERARTALEVALPDQDPATTIGEITTSNSRLLSELQHMTDVVILASLVIAGCSLAVSVTAGVSDRKRPFSLLRLTGVPLGVLRRVVALEAAVPLVVIAVVSAGTGLMAADLFLKSQLGETLRPPGVGYYIIVLAGILASLGVIASTLPLIERITGPEVARNE